MKNIGYFQLDRNTLEAGADELKRPNHQTSHGKRTVYEDG